METFALVLYDSERVYEHWKNGTKYQCFEDLHHQEL